ncbi:MAG: hypothetical protein SPI77_05150 [Corynebacterium sp.]|nr:hypothetical protein [Corynebacterium sp.]
MDTPNLPERPQDPQPGGEVQRFQPSESMAWQLLPMAVSMGGLRASIATESATFAALFGVLLVIAFFILPPWPTKGLMTVYDSPIDNELVDARLSRFTRSRGKALMIFPLVVGADALYNGVLGGPEGSFPIPPIIFTTLLFVAWTLAMMSALVTGYRDPNLSIQARVTEALAAHPTPLDPPATRLNNEIVGYLQQRGVVGGLRMMLKKLSKQLGQPLDDVVAAAEELKQGGYVAVTKVAFPNNPGKWDATLTPRGLVTPVTLPPNQLT